MIDLGPRAGYMLACYVATAIVLAALAFWLLYDGARQKRLLAELEARGARRRSRGS